MKTEANIKSSIISNIQRIVIVTILLISVGIMFGSNLVNAKATIEEEKAKAKENVKEYTVTLDNVKYTLPVTMKEILANGWKVQESEYFEKVQFGYEVPHDIVLEKDNKAVAVRAVNINPVTNNEYENYLIYSMAGTADLLTVQGVTSSTSVDAMLKIMGKPYLMGGKTENAIYTYTNNKDGNKYTVYCFQDQDRINMTNSYIASSYISFEYNDQGKLVESNVESIFLDTRDILDQQVIDQKDYVEPSKVQDKVTSFTFELDSKCYQLPVPVTKLIKNGWNFPANFKEEYFESGCNYVINLVKGNQTIKVNVKNEEDSPQKIENFTINKLYLDSNTTANYKLPGDIKLGTNKETILSLFENETRYEYNKPPFDSYWNYANQKDSIFYVYYNMIPQEDGNKFHTYVDRDYDGCLTVGIKNGKVATITYEHTPDDTLGSLKTATMEKGVKLTSNQDAFDFFNYSSTRSVWEGGDGQRIIFTRDGLVDSIDESEEWFSGEVPQPCTFDYKDESFTITFPDRSTKLKVKYKILSSERVIFYVEGRKVECTTKYVELNTPEAKYYQTIYLGQKKRLNYNGINNTVKFSKFESGNTKVAKVSKTGIVIPVSTGTAFITGVITKNGIDYCITVRLDVKKPYVKFTTVFSTMKNGAKQKIVAKAYGLTGSIKYSVSNTKIATINSKTGTLTAKGKGTIIVTAKCGSTIKRITIKIK